MLIYTIMHDLSTYQARFSCPVLAPGALPIFVSLPILELVSAPDRFFVRSHLALNYLIYSKIECIAACKCAKRYLCRVYPVS